MSSGVLFRTHYGGDIGHGHIMRCLSIASALQSKDLVSVFLLDEKPENTVLKLNEYKCYFLNKFNTNGSIETSIESDEQEIIRCMEEHNLKILFIDKYSVPNKLLHNLKAKGFFIVGFDDFGLENPLYDLLIDHNHTGDNQYDRSRILGGLEHCVLDESYKQLNDVNRSSNSTVNGIDKLNLFVNLGSGPTSKYEEMILDAFEMGDSYRKFNVFWLGGSKGLDSFFLKYPKQPINKIAYINNMAKFMADMDLAIGSCGVNAIERCAMGIPSLVFRTAENQERNFRNLIDRELVVPVASEDEIVDKLNDFHRCPEALKNASARCRLNIDGKGVYRLADKIDSILTGD